MAIQERRESKLISLTLQYEIRRGKAWNLEGPSTSCGEVSRDHLRVIELLKSCRVFEKRTGHISGPFSVILYVLPHVYTHSMTARFVQL